MTVERIYTYRCPTCKKLFEYDQPAEPLCDGPGDVKAHEPAVMLRVKVRDKDREVFVSQEEGEARAKGALLLPWYLITHGARVGGKLWKPKADDPNWKEEWEELPAIKEAREKFKDDE